MSGVPSRVWARFMSDPPTWVITLFGEHDLATAGEVERALGQAVATGNPIIVDLRPTAFADSSILCALLRAEKRAGRDAFAVVLAPDGEVARLFELVRAGEAVPTFAGIRPAVDSCHPSMRASAAGHRTAPRAAAE